MATGLFWAQIVIAGIGGLVGWFLGGLDGFMYTLVAFVVADYVTAVMCAVRDRALAGKIGWAGIFRKVAIFFLVGAGHLLDRYVLGHDHIVRTAIIFFYLSHEGISLMQNAATLGLPVPEKLRDVLAQLRDRDKPSVYRGENIEGLENKDAERKDDNDHI